MATNTNMATLTATITVDGASIKRADKVRLNLLRPAEYKRAQAKQVAGGAAGGAAMGAVLASIPSVRERLLVPEGSWQMSIAGEGLTFCEGERHVVVPWGDVVAWGISTKDVMITTAEDGRAIIPIASVDTQLLEVLKQALVATKAPKRRVGVGGNVTKFKDAGLGEKLVQIVLVCLGVFVLLFAVLVFALFGV